jgi:diguanylate cyclase (GGDEF)-like protein/PAS domain S-box-containing protein
MTSPDIAQWRAQIFSSLLSVVLVIGAIAAAPCIPLLLIQGMWPMAVLDVIALVWMFAILRLTRLSYTFRVLNFLAIGYAVGIGLLLTVGPISLNYLLAPPVMAVILLGTRPAMFALAISATSIMALGLAGKTNMQVTSLELDPLLASFAVTLNFACIGAMITLTTGTLLKGLSRSLSEVRSVADSLVDGQAELRGLNAELRLTSTALARLNDMVVIAKVVPEPGAVQPIIFVNDASLRRSGYARDEVIGRSMRMLHGPDTDPATVKRIVAAMEREEPVTAELVNYTRDGAPYWVEMEMLPFSSEGADITHWVVIGRDITERRNSAEAIHQLAFYDVLTGLPNRRLLTERLDAMVAASQAGRGLGALVYIDLDNFKKINDACGHAAGDILLTQTAARLSGVVGKRDTVARLGGDEFVVLLEGLGTDPAKAGANAMAVADKVRLALCQPMEIDGQWYQSSASIGVSLAAASCGLGHGSAHDLMREADTAMYHAKAGGRNGVVLFESAMLADAERRLTLERDLAGALDNGELAMHLQLQVDHAGKATGAELLMRWQRPDGILVPPDVFIPIAESSGLIVTLGHWVLRQACAAWLRLDAAGHAMPLSINVSPLQFRQPDFVAQVRATVLESGVPPGQLIFEVTEGLLVDDLDQTIARMHELTAMGIRFSIDDFGTGYSNLAYLKKMPLYELKIDKSFLRDTPHDVNGTALVQSIMAMARHLGLHVVAEGIETTEQAQYLALNGRAGMQGYLFCRPMPLEALIGRLGSADAASVSAAAATAPPVLSRNAA